MHQSQISLLRKLGIDISSIEFVHEPMNWSKCSNVDTPVQVGVRGQFTLDTERFDLMTEYLMLVQTAVNSNNKAVQDLLEQLKTTVRLTK